MFVFFEERALLLSTSGACLFLTVLRSRRTLVLFFLTIKESCISSWSLGLARSPSVASKGDRRHHRNPRIGYRRWGFPASVHLETHNLKYRAFLERIRQLCRMAAFPARRVASSKHNTEWPICRWVSLPHKTSLPACHFNRTIFLPG